MTDRMLIGPANYAGQATAMSRAVSARSAVAAASASLTKARSAIAFDSVIRVPRARWALDPFWRAAWRRSIKTNFNRVLIDGGLPLIRGGIARTPSGRLSPSRSGLLADVRDLAGAGISVGLLFHGSEIRSPTAHLDREPNSPFRSMSAAEIADLQKVVAHSRAVAEAAECPLFVTTPDLLLDVPHATWLPTVVDPIEWEGGRTIDLRRKPVVLSAPSSEQFSGARNLDGTLERLHDAGLITYVRVRGVPPPQMPNLIRNADIVLDKVGLGLYGVIALEAMAAGRLVLGYASPQVRSVLRQVGREIPVVDVQVETLEAQITSIMGAPDLFEKVARDGPAFVADWHSGEVTVQRLLLDLGGLP